MNRIIKNRTGRLPAILLLCTLSPGMPTSSIADVVATTRSADTATAGTEAEKIFINADRMQMNIESGLSVYTGNVKFSQGELVLTGDRITVQQRENEVERVTVIGKPAHYNHVTKKGENIQAKSEKMVYTASRNELVLTINAQVKQTGHQVNSQRIVYDTLKKIVIAGEKADSFDAPDENQRVKITLTPKTAPQKSSKKATGKAR